jgi:hypothetical protein
MHRKKLLTTALLALVGLASITVAEAAAVSYSKGDLFIGFYTNDGSVTKDYLINIGQASLYTGATGSFTLNSSPNTNIGNIGTDLTQTFTASWKTDAAVSWGIFGTTYDATVGNDPTFTLYASATPLSGPYARKGSFTQGAPAVRIFDMGSAYATASSTANSAKGIVQNTTDVNSFASYQTTTSFGYFDISASTVDFGNGTSGAALNLYRMTTGSGSGELVGTFTINDSGIVTFTPVPEPGVCVLAGCGLAFMLFVVRRRRATSVA